MTKIKIAAATPSIKVADCRYNAARIIELMEKAENEQVDLLVLPEFCITGATCESLRFHQTLHSAAEQALQEIAQASTDKNFAVVLGIEKQYEGFTIPDIAIVSKGECGYVNIGLDLTFGEYNLCFYPSHYNTEATHRKTILISLESTPEILGEADRRRLVAKNLSHDCIYVHANNGWGESTTDHVYSGHNIIAQNGQIIHESISFGDGWAVAEIAGEHTTQDKLARHEEVTHTISPHPFIQQCPNPAEALNIQAAGLANRIRHTNPQTVAIGISGGLDSTLALLVTVRAYKMLNRPSEEITAITMPCFGTTSRTKNNAYRLCQALGLPLKEIDIHASVTQHLQDIGHPPNKYDVVFENAQARMRTMVLMNVANQQNGFVIGTGSLSELALGWATYNGDHMSMYAVNAGVPKTLVRHLVEYEAKNSPHLQSVLTSILQTKVSPELLPPKNDEITQITEEVVGPYELHDFFIYHMLQHRCGPIEIFRLAKSAFPSYPPEVIKHWLETFISRFFSQQFKRNCMPDGPQVVGISLSPRQGVKLPSDASASAWIEELSCTDARC